MCACVCVCVNVIFNSPMCVSLEFFFLQFLLPFFLIVPTEKKISHFFLSFKTFIHSFILAFFLFLLFVSCVLGPVFDSIPFFYIVVFFCFVANHTHTQCFIEHLNFFFIFVHFKMNEWIKKKMNTNNEYGMHIYTHTQRAVNDS